MNDYQFQTSYSTNESHRPVRSVPPQPWSHDADPGDLRMAAHASAVVAPSQVAAGDLWRRIAFHYFVATCACAAFSAMYEHFSHGVWSWWMVGLAGFPLLLGVVPALLCAHQQSAPSPVARELWACGVVTLALGSCLMGVLEIYGTTSALMAPYRPAGVALLVLSCVAGAMGKGDVGRA
jgi:hypothetical protein